MEGDILIRYALDASGQIVHVKNAVKGQVYYCPECGDRLKFRNGEVRRPHFAHINGGSCSHESTLHAVFKKKAADLFNQLIGESNAYELSWTCPDCGFQYKGSLLHRAVSVEIEHNLGSCRPDVALLDEEGKTVVAFEVVVSHDPEPKAVQYYDEQGIVMVIVNPDKDEELDFNDVGAVIADRAKVSLCCNMECRSYRATKVERKIIKEALPCKKCGQNYERLIAISKSPLGDFGIPDLTEAELADWTKLSSHPAYVVLSRVQLFNREMVTLRTRCSCKSAKTRATPSNYYYDNRKGKYVRKIRF